MASLEKNWLTPEQYLEIERAADFKSEYISGEMVAMSGTSLRHSLIISNISLAIGNQIAQGPCEMHISNLRVHVGTAFFYPDVLVVCGEPQLLDDGHLDTLLNPTVIVEVLSKSTEGYDRGIKFVRYAQIASLTGYILISQDSSRVEHFTRLPDGDWLPAVTHTAPDSVLEIATVGCSVGLSDIYRRVSWEGE